MAEAYQSAVQRSVSVQCGMCGLYLYRWTGSDYRAFGLALDAARTIFDEQTLFHQHHEHVFSLKLDVREGVRGSE